MKPAHTDPAARTAVAGQPSSRRFVPGLLLCLMLTLNAHGQTPGATASAAAAVQTTTAYVIKFKVKPGSNAAFENAMGEMMAQVRAQEPGNLYCDLLRLPQDPQTYVVMERYQDAQATKAHGESAYIKKLGEALMSGLLDGPPELQELVFVRSK